MIFIYILASFFWFILKYTTTRTKNTWSYFKLLKKAKDLLIDKPRFSSLYLIPHSSHSDSWSSLNLYFLLMNWSLNLSTIRLTKQLFAFSSRKNIFFKFKFKYLL